MSGAIGGFLDVASNFNTQAFLEDNLIGQFYILEKIVNLLSMREWLASNVSHLYVCVIYSPVSQDWLENDDAW